MDEVATAGSDDTELAGIAEMVDILNRYDEATRARMLRYLCNRFPMVIRIDNRIGE